MYFSIEIEIKKAAKEAKDIKISAILFLYCIVNIIRFDKNSPCGRISPVRGDQIERMEMS